MKDGHTEEFLSKQTRRLELYTSMRKQGMTYKEIADKVGLCKETVEQFCRANGLGYSTEEIDAARLQGAKHNEACFKPSTNWQEKVNAKYEGYAIAVMKVTRRSNGESSLLLKCLECGETINTTSGSFRSHPTGGCCPTCKRERERIEKEKRKEKERKDKEETRRIKRLQSQKLVQLSIPMCIKCGQIVPTRRKVCDICKQAAIKEQYRRADIKRRARIKNAIKDKDITLEKLFERDNGVCYICGQMCDWNDSKWKDGVFIVGKKYPTVEHLKPLSKGGMHTWNNIRLACLSCNSKKYNREAA